ncbi:hypothetical protein DVS77_23620 [Mycolicibacterium moriokaense]|nr:hypothetical protein DVS77_23620 [Mycolicibacterium moriokaense]
MIDDLWPWKDELLGIAGRLEAKTKQKRWTDRTDLLIERDFVFGAYLIRKLIESARVSDATAARRIPVRRFDVTGHPPRAGDDIADFYDFAVGRRGMRSVADLCEAILRGVVFAICCGETADLFDGVYLSPDPDRRVVELVLASDFIALCNDVGVEKSV